jgi:DNA sulfur modification protein DndE
MSLETIRISKKGKDQMVRLKRFTGIKTWNILCRWAFLKSIAEPAPPPKARIPTDGSVEMTWRTFGGEYQDLYLGLLRFRLHEDGHELDEKTLAQQFRLHVHRGLGYLAADKSIGSIKGLIEQAQLTA